MFRLSFTNNTRARRDAMRALIGQHARIHVSAESRLRPGEVVDCVIRTADAANRNWLMVREMGDNNIPMAPSFRIIPEHIHILDLR